MENDIGILRFEIARIDKEIKALKISARKFAAPSTTAHWIELQRTNEMLKMRLSAALKPGKDENDEME